MIEIDAVLDEGGVLRSCKVRGHATAGHKGRDIVCAAVSVLTRTAMRVLSGREGILVRGGAPKQGVFWMEMDYTAEEGKKFLFAVGNFLVEGLGSVSADYPDYCKMTIYRAEERVWLENEAVAAPKTDGIPIPNISVLRHREDRS